MNTAEQWLADCKHWRGRALTGAHGHYCPDWDGLPIDETTPEWPCRCDVGLAVQLALTGEVGPGEEVRPVKRGDGNG